MPILILFLHLNFKFCSIMNSILEDFSPSRVKVTYIFRTFLTPPKSFPALVNFRHYRIMNSCMIQEYHLPCLFSSLTCNKCTYNVFKIFEHGNTHNSK